MDQHDLCLLGQEYDLTVSIPTPGSLTPTLGIPTPGPLTPTWVFPPQGFCFCFYSNGKFKLFYYIYLLGQGARGCHCVCEGHRTPCKSQFSLSARGFCDQAYRKDPLPAGPSCHPALFLFLLSCFKFKEQGIQGGVWSASLWEASDNPVYQCPPSSRTENEPTRTVADSHPLL